LRIRKNDDNIWYKVPVIEEGKSVLFFGADLLERLTNGVVKAGVHQVIVDSSLIQGTRCSSRLSVALFNYANFGLPIKAMPEFVTPENPQRYPTTTQEEHSQNAYETRFTLTYMEKENSK